MTDISTRSRITRLLGSEKVPIEDKDGAFNYITPVDMEKALRSARVGSFSKWNAAKARGASAPARCLFAGDSNVMGHGYAATALFTQGFARDFADQMGWLTGSILGSQNRASNTIAKFKVYNPTVATTGGWSVDSGLDIIGASLFKSTSGSGVDFTWTPTESFDKLRLWYPRASGLNAAITVTVDSVLLETFSQSGANGLLVKEYALSLGTHTVVIGCSGSGDAFFSALEIQDTTNGTPVYLQGGWYGSTIADHNKTTSAWSAYNQLDANNFDYVMQYCTINDQNVPTALNTYYASMETFVKKASETADGCLFYGYPANSAAVTNGYGDSMASILRGIAKDYDWSFLDARDVFGHSYVRANDLSLAFDGSHPNAAGHNALADATYALLGDLL